jgi:hypothetical protein
MNSKYTNNRVYRDFKIVDSEEEPAPKKAILLKTKKTIWKKIWDRLKDKFNK